LTGGSLLGLQLGQLNTLVLVWGLIGLVFWGLYITFVSYSAQFLYFCIWTVGAGVTLWVFRDGLRVRLQGSKVKSVPRYILLGYAMVLSEEIVAAFVNNLSKGFSPHLFAIRILQFWAFNLLAFSGWIIAWSWMSRWFLFSLRERFYLSGLWGLYAEKTIFYLFTNPLAFFFTAPLEMLTYGIILAPANLGVPAAGSVRSLRWVRYAAAFVLPYLLSLPFLALLIFLRMNFPWAFPPLKFIP
jgi:hypothetical protein